MADVLERDHPLAGRTDLGERTASHVSVLPFQAQVVVRGSAPGATADALAAVGVDLPVRAGTWNATPAGKVVWTGPDEWLLLDTGARPWDLEQELLAVVAPTGGAVTDVSAQRTVLRITGPHARDLLAGGCAVDTHPSRFPAGSAAQGTLGEAGVVLLSLSDDGTEFEVLVRSSFARYLADWLVDAALDLGPTTR